MSPFRRAVLALTLTPLLLAPGGAAQEAPARARKVASDAELLAGSEEEIQSLRQYRARHVREVGERAEARLKRLLELYPDTPLRSRVEGRLTQVRELLADYHFKIANLYVDRAGRGGSAKEARERLLKIVKDYPDFSRIDEVLFFLGEMSLITERLEEAANYFWKLVCQFPASKRAAEAFGRLDRIGMHASKGCEDRKSVV
jgi:tetratricopeptide (TPR) repeat protein